MFSAFIVIYHRDSKLLIVSNECGECNYYQVFRMRVARSQRRVGVIQFR